jgi:photosynthetic reaction center cytochrome c subunit
MRLGSSPMIFGAMAAVMCLLCVPPVNAQIGSDEKPPLSEEVFKNIQVLKGISVNEFMSTMGFFSASVGLNCVYCHVPESLENWQKFAEDVPLKRTARNMILMVNALNKNSFGGRRAITCYSCHRGAQRPKVIPSLADQYSVPLEDPNEVEIVPQAPPGQPADDILGKYVLALGGLEPLSAITSVVAQGTYEGYETYHQKVPFELFANASGQLSTIVHTQNGLSTTTLNGSAGWIAAPDKPVPLLPMTGDELDGAKLDAEVFFPAGIKQTLASWRVGFPVTSIGDREVQIVQGTGAGKLRVKLYFDRESGILVREVRYAATIVGINPTQIDYSDFRSIPGAGVKMPFRWTVTWTNGQSNIELSDVQTNVPIDAAKFAKPAPAVVTPVKAVR